MQLFRHLVLLKTKVRVHRWSVDNLAGVENIFRIPNAFQLADQLIIVIAYHLWDKLTAQSSISMFTRKRAVVFLD